MVPDIGPRQIGLVLEPRDLSGDQGNRLLVLRENGLEQGRQLRKAAGNFIHMSLERSERGLAKESGDG